MLKKRVAILEQGNIISKEVADYVTQVVDLLNEDIKEYEMNKAEMFITHVAMSTQRVITGVPVKSPDEAIWEEVIESEYYAKAEAFFQRMQTISPVACPEGERRFIILHLCSLLEAA